MLIFIRVTLPLFFSVLIIQLPPTSTRTDTLFPAPALFRSARRAGEHRFLAEMARGGDPGGGDSGVADRAERRGQDHDAAHPGRRAQPHRSEEHTSELQSLMRISYAVFCLKKQNKYDHY